MNIDQTRFAEIEALPLAHGSHGSINEGLCVMEAVAYIAGEPWTDSPACACPVIAAFLRSWNDGLPDDKRQDLKQYIPLLVGTRGDEKLAERRSLMAADWMVRTHTPAWLRLAGLTEQADALSGLPEITSRAQVPSIKPAIEAARTDAAAARAAARAAAWDAARAAAWDAAWDAARAAAWDAAGDAARAAARAAAWDAARAAARDAAWAAARAAAGAAAGAAARAKLKPTQDELYKSAHILVRRMLEANGKRVLNEHAPFTTREREVIKSAEFRQAHFGASE